MTVLGWYSCNTHGPEPTTFCDGSNAVPVSLGMMKNVFGSASLARKNGYGWLRLNTTVSGSLAVTDLTIVRLTRRVLGVLPAVLPLKRSHEKTTSSAVMGRSRGACQRTLLRSLSVYVRPS